MMRQSEEKRPLIVGNWKMNGTYEEGCTLIDGTVSCSQAHRNVEVVVCPPFTLLDSAVRKTQGTMVSVGAQNAFYEERGAYTGEISPSMLKEIGCKWVIAGHSERRIYFGENDSTVNRKLKLLLGHGLVPILCVGESLAQRKEERTFEVLNSQIVYGLEGIDSGDIQTAVIAYEPVWAIGTGISATQEQAEEVHGFIRSVVERFAGKRVSETVRILYGGSVSPANADRLLGQENIDGALVGGASLRAESFCEIVRIASSAVKSR